MRVKVCMLVCAWLCVVGG